MNEIFYRAWHKEQQKMYAVLAMYWVDSCPTHLDYLLLHGGLKVLPNDVVLMRSTGISDDNEILIYEGHIVAHPEGQDEVIYQKGTFWVADKPLHELKQIKVIGNVFELKNS